MPGMIPDLVAASILIMSQSYLGKEKADRHYSWAMPGETSYHFLAV